jgi:hypothetical protein
MKFSILKKLVKECVNELVEVVVNDPELIKLINELGINSDKIREYKSQIELLSSKNEELEVQLRPILEALVDTEDRVMVTKEYVARIEKKGFERSNNSYKNAFELALTKVNEATKNILKEALEKTKTVTKVLSKIGIDKITENMEMFDINKELNVIDKANAVMLHLNKNIM